MLMLNRGGGAPAISAPTAIASRTGSASRAIGNDQSATGNANAGTALSPQDALVAGPRPETQAPWHAGRLDLPPPLSTRASTGVTPPQVT